MSTKTAHRNYSPISLALKKFLSRKELSGISIGTEYISLDKSTDRILAGNIRCPIDIPPFQRSTVDGYAILSDDTLKATRSHQVVLNVIGQLSAGEISPRELAPAGHLQLPPEQKFQKAQIR